MPGIPSERAPGQDATTIRPSVLGERRQDTEFTRTFEYGLAALVALEAALLPLAAPGSGATPAELKVLIELLRAAMTELGTLARPVGSGMLPTNVGFVLPAGSPFVGEPIDESEITDPTALRQ